MSNQTKVFAAVLLLSMLTIEFGGQFLLSIIQGANPGFENARLFSLFRAGHAHAGVWVLLALVAMPYIDEVNFRGRGPLALRLGFGAAPILISAGFFGAASPLAAGGSQLGPLVALIYIGATTLALSLVGLAVGLLSSR